MSEIIYNTKEECLKAIESFKAAGYEPMPWMLDQLKSFEESAANVVQDPDTPIWNTLKAKYPYGVMPEEKVKCVEDTVAQLLEIGPRSEEPGLLLGKIQCGKTDTFEDIIGLSFDRGVDVAIVITKGTKALVGQTIKRMKKDYRYFRESDILNQKATINIYDIMEIGRHGLQRAKVESSKIVIVCKKEPKNMERLIDLFERKSMFLKRKKVIVVDDEADFASRNYRSVKPAVLVGSDGNPIPQKAEMGMARISQQIDDFRKIPDFCRYLQVTATPYCLYLQPDGELNLNGNVVKPFKPRFTSIVPTHKLYVGGQQYFVESKDPDSMYSHLYYQVEQKCIDVMGHEDKRYLNRAVASSNLYGLTRAILAFFMATAVRRIQKRQEGKDYKSSAVIHVDIDRKEHQWQLNVVNRLIEDIKKAIVDEEQSDQRIVNAIQFVYDDYKESNRKGRESNLISVSFPTLDDVLNEIKDIFSPRKKNYHVQLVNSDEDMVSMLDEESGELRLETAANIFIGGNILDRGVTIKNMLCFFYGRNPKNFKQDTVLQHARMYGARPKEDMAVMRLHTTNQIYNVLVRMNDLDEQLRQWFIEDKDQLEPNAVFVGYDKNIKPCAASKIKASNALLIQPQKRVLPVGFWTGSKKQIRETVEKIDGLIENAPQYRNKDTNGFFEIDKALVADILDLIESTYIYEPKLMNMDHRNDMKELRCVLDYCASKSDGKLFALHRIDRNMSRVRDNGSFVDAPDDGRTDVKPSKEIAIDRPVIMFIRQNGNIEKDPITGESKGWNGAHFYWPVLMPQLHITPVMYSFDQKAKSQVVTADQLGILDGINPEEVLKLTYRGDLEGYFGREGTEYSIEKAPVETRSLKDSTAGRYIQKNEDGDWALSEQIDVNAPSYHGLYTLNDGVFPFKLKHYKYLLLRNGRDARADVMLLELHDAESWDVMPIENCINDNGDLFDRDTNEVLLRTSDTIVDKDLTETDFVDHTVTQWLVVYKVKKVLKYVKNNIDWDVIFNDSEVMND